MLANTELGVSHKSLGVSGIELKDMSMFGTALLKPRRLRAGWPEALRAAVAVFFAIALVAFLGSLSPTSAQRLDRFTRSYVTPFPQNDRYRVVVFGDSLGDGIWQGLYRAFEADSNVEVIKRSRGSTGFTRRNRSNLNTGVKGILKSERVHVAVIMVGVSDMQAIKQDRKWHKIGSDEWREIYGERVDQFIKSLKGSRVAIYWVGLPIMRSPKHNQDMQVLNEIYREKAFVNGIKFVDTWNGFADQFGRYSAYGPDLTGQVRRLRAPDGVHFTGKGHRKLAHFVEREIRGDMKLARAERNIPLAGNKIEQDRAMGRLRGRAGAAQKGKQGDGDKPGDRLAKNAAPKGDAEAEAAAGGSNRERKTNRAIAGVKLVRPKISDAAPVTLGSNYTPMGETIALEMGNGLTALASISPFNDTNLSNIARRLPLSQRPYFRVLIKGEQLLPKSGRADDFAWPGS